MNTMNRRQFPILGIKLAPLVPPASPAQPAKPVAKRSGRKPKPPGEKLINVSVPLHPGVLERLRQETGGAKGAIPPLIRGLVNDYVKRLRPGGPAAK